MGGDTDAAALQTRLLKYNDRKARRYEPTAGLDKSGVAFKEKFEKHSQLSRTADHYYSIVYAIIERDLKTGYEENHGSPPERAFSKPYYITDVETGKRVVQKLGNMAKKSREPGSSEVGYGKPPVVTRWKKNQSGNPSGKRRAAGDGWNEFRAGLLQRVPIVVNGKKKTLAGAAIVTTQLLDLAIKGNAKARCEVEKLLVALDQRDLLSAPPPRRRPRRSDLASMSPELLLVTLRLVELSIQKDMQQDFELVYGPDERFQENIKIERHELLAKFRALKSARKEQA